MKPLAIRTADGLHVVVPATAPLPCRVSVMAKTTDDCGEIRIPVVEGGTPIGETVMHDIPTSLPISSLVKITVTCEHDGTIGAFVYVPSLEQGSGASLRGTIRGGETTKDIDREYEILRIGAEGAKGLAGRAALLQNRLGNRLDRRLKSVREALDKGTIDPVKIREDLQEIRRLTNSLRVGWVPNPPREVFDGLARLIRELIAETVSKQLGFAERRYDHELDAICAEADSSYEARDSTRWQMLFERLDDFSHGISTVVGASCGDLGTADCLLRLLRHALHRTILSASQEHDQEMHNSAGDWGKRMAQDPRVRAFSLRYRNLADSLRKINPGAGDAVSQFQQWYITQYQPIEQWLGKPHSIGLVRIDTSS